ncbi:MAG: hypothetical protein K0S68_580 [Candidatus Saccharibacteria bacterium]|jgi:uncharacterized metal-binding protein YceD (DUF177 family)|nr:hypothetical protein [Candidatus Saccharibacteria bacterium]
MHINVRDILSESVGYSRAYKISGERPNLESLELTRDIEGEITISRIDSGLLTQGHLESELELVCDRCLSTFTRPTSVRFQQLFAEEPGDEELPIVDESIDLALLAEQEFLLDLPIKLLHAPDCPGIPDAAGKYTKEDSGTRLQDQARIKKGNPPRGRT